MLALAGEEPLVKATAGLARRARPLLLTGAAEGNAALLLGLERRSAFLNPRADEVQE